MADYHGPLKLILAGAMMMGIGAAGLSLDFPHYLYIVSCLIIGTGGLVFLYRKEIEKIVMR